MTQSNITQKTQVFENSLGEKIGYLLYSIIFTANFIVAFTESGTGIAGNLLGLNTGLLYGFHKIKNFMQINLQQSKTKFYWYALVAIELLLGTLFYLSTIENIVVTVFSIFFIFLFTSMTQLILVYIFSKVTLTIIPLEKHFKIQSQTDFILLRTQIIYEIPYEAKLNLYRATLFDKPDKFSNWIYYIQVKRPEGIVIYNIKLKVMPFIRIKEIEQFFEDVPNFEITSKLQNAIIWEKRIIKGLAMLLFIGFIILILAAGILYG